jgi:hypothetical protein
MNESKTGTLMSYPSSSLEHVHLPPYDHSVHKICGEWRAIQLVQDDLPLPHDGGEKYSNLKEEVGNPNPSSEISSLHDRKTCQVVNWPPMLWRWPVDLMSSKKKKKKKSLGGYTTWHDECV